jgi:alpha-galactosidase
MTMLCCLEVPATLSATHSCVQFDCGDFIAVYTLKSNGGQVEWILLPKSKREAVAVPRRFLETPEILCQPKSALPIPARRNLTSLVQLKLREDNATGGFAGGRSMRASKTLEGLHFEKQCFIPLGENGFEVRTILAGARDFRCAHVLRYEEGDEAVAVHTEFENTGDKTVSLEMISSFCMGGVSPFDSEDSVDRLRLHRFRSLWSCEGRHEARDFEDLHLERSWMNASVVNERFGQVGSMPVRGWFPFVAIEDKKEGVFWAVQLAIPGSWQLEVFRLDDKVSLSGGLADREFGHWMKTVPPGGRFVTPSAVVTAACGGLDGVCQRLVRMQEKPLRTLPPLENELPILFNEWCSSWGTPTPRFIALAAERLQKTPVRIFVIDDGWAEKPDGAGQFNGDWDVERRRFPDGLNPVADDLRSKGLIPGLWFEFEVCTDGTKAFALADHKLCRDGRTLQIGTRHFWDFTDPWTFEYLREKVIARLRDDGFGYLKVDYNDTIGLGCDHPDSLGEGLRLHLDGVQKFFRELRKALPDLIIEICSSGGHRLEPSFMALASMGSFSDAHECPEIPIIAANLHRLILPRQNQIWAVLHASDSLQRMHYSLAATFLGRVCLSGEITKLGEDQFALLQADLALYERVKHLILDGESTLHRHLSKSWRRPRGWQVVTRISRQGHPEALLVVHAFGESAGSVIPLSLPSGVRWEVAETHGIGVSANAGAPCELYVKADFSACVLHFRGVE